MFLQLFMVYCSNFLTSHKKNSAVVEAAWWARGPEALSGADDDTGSLYGVACITAVLQNGAHGERASVCLRHIYSAMLDGERSHATWGKNSKHIPH